MNREEFVKLLEDYEHRRIGRRALLEALFPKGFSDLGHSRVDTSRLQRVGFPEAVYCRNKTGKEVADIARELHRKNGFVLLTRASQEQYQALRGQFPRAAYHSRAGVITIGEGLEKKGRVCVLSAGTSDYAVAEEAALTAELLGCTLTRVYDVGVAGLHRLVSHTGEMEGANVIIAVAGMEGALPSVVGGLVRGPVIGVPTSVGYGASFQGVSALLTMLNSCAPGVCVVNIDNGFGAGYLASVINRRIEQARGHE